MKTLQEICDALDSINHELNEVERIWSEELADRQSLGLEAVTA